MSRGGSVVLKSIRRTALAGDLPRLRRILGAVLVVILLSGIAVSLRLAHHAGQIAASAPSSTSETAAPPIPAAVTLTPADGTRDVDPLAPVAVTATAGQLVGVDMRNERGVRITGVMTPDNLVWKPGVPLGYGRTYGLTVTARGTDGVDLVRVFGFSTLTPSNQTKVSFTTTGVAALREGGTYGVGTVVVARFDEPIPDRAAAERQLSVRTTPPVTGSWFWLDDQNAHWRPPSYFAPNTVVTAQANIYGVPLGDGLYGQEDAEVSFRIGDSHISVANDITKQVSVFDNGRLVRTMPTSMGMGGTEIIGDRTISFWTQPGVYTVMDKANPVVMDSSTYGLPINSRLGYKQTINWATRISTDGIYLHELEDTVWAQGNTNVSHGCLNLNGDNARWFFDFSQPGDVVEVRYSGGEPLQVWQNGDWSVPWNIWQQGSALGK